MLVSAKDPMLKIEMNLSERHGMYREFGILKK